jgi:hypothetical protein
MRRTLTSALLCVSLLCLSLESIAATSVLNTGNAETAHRKITKAKKYKKIRKHRRYSDRRWRRHHARLKRYRALQARRRAMRSRHVPIAVAPTDPGLSILPLTQQAPAGWQRSSVKGSEVRFSVDEGRGSAAISVIGNAIGETVDSGRHQMIGGVPTTTLRREVINRMFSEQGWVVNDYQKEMGGRSVYVVVAQSPGRNGHVHSRMYYFTESDGRIYSLSTNSSIDAANRIAEESEKVINSLKPNSVQRAAIPE